MTSPGAYIQLNNEIRYVKSCNVCSVSIRATNLSQGKVLGTLPQGYIPLFYSVFYVYSTTTVGVYARIAVSEYGQIVSYGTDKSIDNAVVTFVCH